jgi:hypothetical protein
MDEAPRGRTNIVTRQIGKNVVVGEEFIPDLIIAAGNDRVVTLSRWLPKEGRWNMFSKDTPPVAWKTWPKHPQDEADEAAAMAFWRKADG